MKNNKLLIIGTAIALAISGIAGVASRKAAKAVHADYVEEYTLDGSITASGNAYATASTVTQNNVGWKVVGNTEQSPWRIGGKSITKQDRQIYSTTALSANIAKIEVTSGATASSLSVNSLTISVHNNASDAQNGSNAVATKSVTSGIESSTVVFEKEDSTSWANKFYRIVYNVTRTSSSGNGYITFESATFSSDDSVIPTTKTLQSITLSGTYPTSFMQGEAFNHEGLVVTATYDDDSTSDVTSFATFSGYNLSTTGNQTVTVSYTEGEETATATYGITVGAAHGLTDDDPLTVAMGLGVINSLTSGGDSVNQYYIEGYIVSIETEWSTQYHNITFTIGDTENATNVITSFRSKVTGDDDQIGGALAVGDFVSVHGYLTKYIKNNEPLPQIKTGAIVTCKIEGSNHGQNIPVVIDDEDLDEESDDYTVEAVKACTAADNTVIAKVTGVAEDKYGDAKYGNFHLTNPETGNEITIYGGYTTVTFTRTNGVYTSVHSNPVDDSIVGKSVTVYGTIGYHNEVGQIVNAKVVVGSAYTGNVNVSYLVNDNNMGSAQLSATSIAYGQEVVVTPVPAQGYQVQTVEVERITSSEELTAEANGTYKFNAQAKNVVHIAFEEASVQPSSGVLFEADLTNGATVTNGFNISSSGASQKAGYYQDNAGTVAFTVTSQSALFSSEPFKITLTAELGGGSAKDPLENPVKVCFVDAQGNDIANTETTLTTKIVSAAASEYSVNLSYNANAYGLKLFHDKETGFNVRYYSFNLEVFESASGVEDYLSLTSSFATVHGVVNTSSESGTYNVTFANSGLGNGAAISNVNIGPVLLSAAKGTSKTDPGYYNEVNSIHLYGGNVLTFTSETNITSIKFTYAASGGSDSGLECSTFELNEQEQVWEGSAATVSFDVKAVTSSGVQLKIKSVELVCGEKLTVSSVALRFGARIPQSVWSSLNGTAQEPAITNYGVMLATKDIMTQEHEGLTIAEAYHNANERRFTVVQSNSSDTPFPQGDDYVFTAKVNISGSHSKEYVAAPFIVVDGHYYFLDEMTYSVNTLAVEYLKDGNYTLTNAALSILAND